MVRPTRATVRCAAGSAGRNRRVTALPIAAADTRPHAGPTERFPRRGEGMPVFDRIVRETLEKFGVPGASLAVVKDGRLVVAKGYGWANVAQREPVTPQTLFSLASVSKPVSAIAVLHLVEQGRLSLDDRVYDVLGRPAPLPGMQIVPRAARSRSGKSSTIRPAGCGRTIRWPNTKKIAAELHSRLPIPSELVVRWALCHPLGLSARHASKAIRISAINSAAVSAKA